MGSSCLDAKIRVAKTGDLLLTTMGDVCSTICGCDFGPPMTRLSVEVHSAKLHPMVAPVFALSPYVQVTTTPEDVILPDDNDSVTDSVTEKKTFRAGTRELLRTKIGGGNLTPSWEETHMTDCIPHELEVHVFTSNLMSGPTHIGTAIVPCSPIMKTHEKDTFAVYKKGEQIGEICMSVRPAAAAKEDENAAEATQS